MSDEAERIRSTREAIRERARGQLSMLIAQFLVGLAVSRIGVPSETSGAARIVSIVLLALHLVISAGLAAGAILAIGQVARLDTAPAGLVWGGAAAIGVSVGAGVMTYLTGSDWWSYLMGAGATVSLPLYGLLYIRAIGEQPASPR